jgi:hypothetical protein
VPSSAFETIDRDGPEDLESTHNGTAGVSWNPGHKLPSLGRSAAARNTYSGEITRFTSERIGATPALFLQIVTNSRNLTWAPPRSPVRIEYSTDILLEVLKASGSGDARGLLFGMRNAKDVWILAASHLSGSAPVGIFVARIRGEVFLTEADLEFFETQRADLALAIVGAKGGFFVREADGSVQTIQSLEEFPVPLQ